MYAMLKANESLKLSDLFAFYIELYVVKNVIV